MLIIIISLNYLLINICYLKNFKQQSSVLHSAETRDVSNMPGQPHVVSNNSTQTHTVINCVSNTRVNPIGDCLTRKSLEQIMAEKSSLVISFFIFLKN